MRATRLKSWRAVLEITRRPVSLWAALTQCHRAVGDLDTTETSFSQFGGLEVQVGCWHGQVLVRPSSGLQLADFSLCPRVVVRGAGELWGGPFYQARIPLTSQMGSNHVLKPSHWELGLQNRSSSGDANIQAIAPHNGGNARHAK